MPQDDLDGEQLLRAMRSRLREAAIPAAVRRRVLFRLGGVLRIGHERLEELLCEAPVPVEMENLYEALLEVAVRHECLDELDMILRMGGAEALGVDVAEHGSRVAGLLGAPRVEAPRVRGIPGAGVLEDLMAGEETLLLGASHGPSARCPSCTSFAPLEGQGIQRKTKSGIHSRHSLRCPVCLARGDLERYYSFRLRGNRDRVLLHFPGLLGPWATRRWARRSGGLSLLLSLGLGAVGYPWEPALLVGLVWLIRSQSLGPVWEVTVCLLGLLASGMGLVQEVHALWFLALGISLLGLIHVLWCLVRRPEGWSLQD